MAARLHATLCAMVVAVVEPRRARTVALGGGCFQHRRLVESIDPVLDEAAVQRALALVLVAEGDPP